MSSRLLNLGLRMVSLGSRFLLAIVLAKAMLAEDFGFYGLLAAAVTYLVYVVGIDFYTYTVRDLVARPTSAWRALLRDQFLLYGATFSLVAVASAVLCLSGLLSGSTLLWLLLLLASEHVAQELNRLLIIAGKVLHSSVALFIRSGLWVLLLVALWWRDPATPLSLATVLQLWLGGGLLAIVWSLFCLRQVLCDRSSAAAPVDWARLRAGVQVAALFFAGTLILKFASTADRFLVEHFAGLAAVGPYVLYVGLAGAIAALVDAAVVVYDYPGLIRAWQAGDEALFRRLHHAFFRRIALYSLAVALLLAAFLHPVLEFIGKPQVTAAWPLAVPLILANVLLALANVPHYALYAAGQDRRILLATSLGTGSFLLAALAAGYMYGALGVAWASCGGALAVYLSKAVLWRLVLRQQVWTSDPGQCDPAPPASI